MAGNNSHEIHVFPIDQLLKGQAKPVVLRSVGTTFRQAAFIQNGKSVGLMLSETAKAVGQGSRAPKAGDLVFDLNTRKLGGDPTGWNLATPDLGEWSAAAKT